MVARAPTDPPTFTVAQLRKAIPAHCFERSAYKSSLYLFRDFAFIWTFFYLATHIDGIESTVGRYTAWAAYWYFQGLVMTGVWVIAHECGHGAFAAQQWIGDAVGYVLHTMLLVPYGSWKITHRNHHSNTGGFNDEVFVPYSASEMEGESLFEDTPIGTLIELINMLGMLVVGWWMYLFTNVHGGPKYRSMKGVNHFMPSSPLFKEGDAAAVTLSTVLLVLWGVVLYNFSAAFGWETVLKYYGIPIVVVNYHLVALTYLQHTALYLPHYRGKSWNWLQGALSTVDRDFCYFGFELERWTINAALHHITDTHVAHHLFSTMPFYHAQEATAALRKVLGEYHCYDATPTPKALWDTWRSCKCVPDEGEVVFYGKPSRA